MDLKAEGKQLHSVSVSLKRVFEGKARSGDDKLKLLRAAKKALEGLDVQGLRQHLAQAIAEEEALASKALSELRSVLLKAASQANIQFKQFQEFDRIDIFDVQPRATGVVIRVGSIAYKALASTDGAMVLDELLGARRALDAYPYSREDFGRRLITAVRVVGELEGSSDGYVEIRRVHAMMSGLKLFEAAASGAKAHAKGATDYPEVQFVFDLARFGREGWTIDGRRIQGKVPNMATVQENKAITLPNLTSVLALGEQFAHIRVVAEE